MGESPFHGALKGEEEEVEVEGRGEIDPNLNPAAKSQIEDNLVW